MGKPTMWFPTRSDTNQSVQLQKQARSLKFRCLVEEELYYPSSEKKGADQLRGYRFAVTAKLICAFLFAYADCWFSHGAAHIFWHKSDHCTHCIQGIKKRHQPHAHMQNTCFLISLEINMHFCHGLSFIVI